MEIKCNFNPYFSNNYFPSRKKETSFSGYEQTLIRQGEKITDKFVRRPVATTSATGLLGLKIKVLKYLESYKQNISHTVDHKIIFALIEKELFGKNSIDCITHDLDKLILYILGFPKSFVTKFHRKHSEHHIESGKKMNLNSMTCDNIASSPDFKPEKKMALRAYYSSNKNLQEVEGFKEILEKYNYGENLDFNKIKNQKKVLSLKMNKKAQTFLNFTSIISAAFNL